MSLPKSVIEAGERADALMNALQTGNQPAAPAPQPAPAAPPAAPAPAPEPGSAQAPQVSAPDDASLEHRFKVLQGKYNAEVPRYVSQVSELNARNQELERLNRELTQKLAAAPPPQPLIRPEEIEEHGENLVDLIRRAAREESAADKAKIAELEQRLTQLGSNVAPKRGFLEVLAEKVPGWAVTNDDSTFHRWLLEKDPLSGRTRQSLLEEAQQQGDGERAANIFITFGKDRDSWAARSADALSSQVVPAAGAGGGNPAATAGQGRIWARAEVTDFYTKVRTGQIKGQEQAAIEAEIQRAMVEGRIR